MALTRRDFLGSLVGAAGGLALSRVPLRRLVGLDDVPPVLSRQEAERIVRSTCLLCPGGCGIEGRLLDGLPVSLRGNALHPINRGGLCAVGLEGLHLLYHPDRIRGPLRRAGDRGSGQWVKISWEEAIAEVADRLGEIHTRKPESVVFLDGFGRGLMNRLIGRFLSALGSPNHILDGPPSGLSAMMQIAQGVPRAPAYDLEGADYVLSFGAPLLEGWRSPLQGQTGYAALRGERGPRRRRFVQVDTRQSLTASRADRWVPVKPGGYGALALSIAYVIIKRNLYDEDFVKRHTFGFESWKDAEGGIHRGFREHVLDRYRPDRMEEVTGVPSRTVVAIAQEFAASRSSVAIVDHAATQYSNGVQAALAVQALNALVGSVERKGGVLIGEEVPFAEWPPLGDGAGSSDRLPPRLDGAGHRFPFTGDSVASVSQGMLGRGAEVGALFLYYSNPCFSTPDPDRFVRAVQRVPFVVSFTPLPDDTSRYADLILPDHTYLERWHDGVGPSSFPYAVLGVTQPVVDPIYDTRHTGDVILQVAKRMGGAVAKALPWGSFEEVVRTSVEGVFRAERGTVLADEYTAKHVRDLQIGGWWIPKHKSFEDFWKDFLEAGGWWDPAYVHGLWGRVFRTPSGKYEFWSQALESHFRGESGEETVNPERLREALDAAGIKEGADVAYLPHHEIPVFDGFLGEKSLHLNIFRPLVPNSGVVPDLPWVREILNPHVAWDLWVEMHPEDAVAMEIENGQWVALISPIGRVRGRALIGSQAQRGVVNVPYGLGREVAGRWGRMRGANPNRLIAGDVDPLAAVPLSQSTLVRLEKEGEGGENA